MEKETFCIGYPKEELDKQEVESILKEIIRTTRNQGRFADKEQYEKHMERIYMEQHKVLGRVYDLLRPLIDE